MEQDLFSYLKKHKISYQEYNHPAVFTVAESHSNPIIQKIPGLRTKNLFIYDEKNRYYLLVCPGEKRVNMKLLKNQLNIKELHFGSPEQLKEQLKITPGSVSLFCMIHSKNVSLLIDKEVWDAKEAGFHPNTNTSTLVLSHENIENFCNSLKSKYQILSLNNE